METQSDLHEVVNTLQVRRVRHPVSRAASYSRGTQPTMRRVESGTR
jgi:hypothetical protein